MFIPSFHSNQTGIPPAQWVASDIAELPGTCNQKRCSPENVGASLRYDQREAKHRVMKHRCGVTAL